LSTTILTQPLKKEVRVMYAQFMQNESKGARIYFKRRYEVAARLAEKDSSELFRHIAKEFIDRVQAEQPREFDKLLAQETTESEENATNAMRGRVETGKAGRKTSQGKKQKQGGK
jgi:hypothetical protein